MNKFLITGFSGFVSKHFVDYLERSQISSAVLGIDLVAPDINPSDYKRVSISFKQVDMFEKGHLEKVLSEFRPDYILHLASFSSVAFSWQNPVTSFQNNTNIFLNLIEAVRSQNINARILSIGSSEEYGAVSASDIPLKEGHVVNPISPYAVARVSQELISKVYVSGYGMDILMTRSFNHVGPGQRDIFAISNFAKQLCQIKLNSNDSLIETGDITVVRDFVDVRDVVLAYHQLFIKGRAGDVYNVCSGTGTTLEDVINIMCEILNIDVEIRVKQSLVRPADSKIIIGSNDKIKNDIGWGPKFSLRESLNDVVAYWLKQLAR